MIFGRAKPDPTNNAPRFKKFFRFITNCFTIQIYQENKYHGRYLCKKMLRHDSQYGKSRRGKSLDLWGL